MVTRYARHSDAAIVTVSEITPETGTSVCPATEGIRKRAAQERASNKVTRFAMASPSTDGGECVEPLNPTDRARAARATRGTNVTSFVLERRPPLFGRGIHLRCAAYYQSEKDLPQTSSRVTKIRLGSSNTPIAASRHRRFGVEGRPTTGRWTGHIRGDGDEIESQDGRGRETVRTAIPGSLMSCGLPWSRTAISRPSTAS